MRKKYGIVCESNVTTFYLSIITCFHKILLFVQIKTKIKFEFTSNTHTECANLYKLVGCSKFVNEILSCIIYKTVYLTLRHHALAVILSSCLNFFWVINSLIVLIQPKKPDKLGVQYFCLWRSQSLAHLVDFIELASYFDTLLWMYYLSKYKLSFFFKKLWKSQAHF